MTEQQSILFVHGRDCKPAEAWFEEISFAALRAGLERDYADCLEQFDAVNCEIAYYGDLTNALLTSRGRHYDEELDAGDRRNALAALREIPVRKRFGIRQYDRLPGKNALPEFFAALAIPLSGALGLWGWYCARRMRDFAEYLDAGSEYGRQVRERLRAPLARLLERGDRVLLLAHGTGSAIAWDVLWQFSHEGRYRDAFGDRKVDVLLTMGCPLGDANLRMRLKGGHGESAARFPTNVISWHNVSAEDDYTCHDKTLADDFRKMMSERIVSAVKDYRIYNHAVRYGKSNPHSSVGYLIHPRVTKIIVDWLRLDEALKTGPGSGG